MSLTLNIGTPLEHFLNPIARFLFQSFLIGLLCSIFTISIYSQERTGYNDPARPLPPNSSVYDNRPYTSSDIYNDTPPGNPSGVGSISAGLSTAPSGNDYPNLDCENADHGQLYYYNLPRSVSPKAGTFVRITFRGGSLQQRERFLVWSNTTLLTKIATAGWQDAAILKWPGGEFRYHLNVCINYKFEWYPTSWDDLSPGGQATSDVGIVRVDFSDALAIIEWGPHVQPPTPPEPQIRLKVGYQKTCKGVNVGLASGYVATNYGHAITVASDGRTPVVVKSLRVAIVYDGPSFPLTRNPVDTVTDQSSVTTSEQLRAVGLGWQSDVVCRGFKVVADATTYGGRQIHAEIHTR